MINVPCFNATMCPTPEGGAVVVCENYGQFYFERHYLPKVIVFGRRTDGLLHTAMLDKIPEMQYPSDQAIFIVGS